MRTYKNHSKVKWNNFKVIIEKYIVSTNKNYSCQELIPDYRRLNIAKYNLFTKNIAYDVSESFPDLSSFIKFYWEEMETNIYVHINFMNIFYEYLIDKNNKKLNSLIPSVEKYLHKIEFNNKLANL